MVQKHAGSAGAPWWGCPASCTRQL